MLAASLDHLGSIQFPVYATPKIDGVRCLKIDGEVVSRTLKPIRNAELAAAIHAMVPDGADGEITVCGSFQNTTSVVMAAAKALDGQQACFWWFDYVLDNPNKPYVERIEDIKRYLDKHEEVITASPVRIFPLIPVEIHTLEGLLRYESDALENGFEGVMLRSAHGPYKFGRSTLKEFSLVKMKKFDDDEAVIIGFNELQKNENDKKKNELGDMKRSSHKAGKKDQGSLGSFVVKWNGLEFSIGSGFTMEQRKEFWNARDTLIGKSVKFKYFSTGMKVAPRFPIFLGIRDPDDIIV